MKLAIDKDYHDNGFVFITDAGVPKKQIMASLQGVNRVMKGVYNTGMAPWAEIDVDHPKKVQRITQIHLADHTLHQLLTDLRIGLLAASITGARQIKIFASQLYFKPANCGPGGIVGFHRDSEHLPYFIEGMLTGWLPLTDIDYRSGPLIFIQGSHQWEKNSQSSGAQIQNIQQQRRDLQSEYSNQNWHEHSAVMPAGGISFHHQDVLHGSPENTSDHPRCVLAFGLLTEKARFNPAAEDYGYADILNNKKYCPIIYQKN